MLDKPLMTWIFQVSVEGAICDPKKINFFFGSDQLLMIEIKSKRVWNNHVGAWYAMTQSKWKYDIFFTKWIWFIFWLFVVAVEENIVDLKFNTFLVGEGGGGGVGGGTYKKK